MAPNDNTDLAATLVALQARMAALEAENAALRASHATPPNDDDAPASVSTSGDDADRPARAQREPTPTTSAFGGIKFRPTGIAARLEFRPYGASSLTKNPAYDKKARTTATDPGKFDGNRDEFDQWVIRVADKFAEDDETFKTERSRMALIYNLVMDPANKLIRTRYESVTNPYSSAAEMIQVLATAYYNQNQASDARAKLSKMMYEPGGKMDINTFIAEVNSLADAAKVPVEDRKQILWEHFPPNIDNHLLSISRDPLVPYESFAQLVADAAYSQQRAYEINQERRRKSNATTGNKTPSGKDKAPRSTMPTPTKNPSTTSGVMPPTVLSAKRPLTDEEKKAHWAKNTCFLCGQLGHIGKDCPDRNQLPSIKALKKRSDNKKSDVESSSDDSEKE
jgi:hypothetical protein